MNQPLHKDGKLYQRLTFAEGLLRAWWDIQTAREEKTTVTINDNWLRNIFGYNDSQECTFYDGLIRMFTKVDNDSTSFEDSICFKYFGFNVKQTETCNACGHVETTEKKEIALPFSISNGLKEQEKIGINELIKYYEEPEKLDDYKCDGCNQQGHAVKVNSIVTPYPKYFLSSIMRYKFDGVDSSRTSIEIDLEDPLEGMNLIGVIAHSGGSSINSGHYTCLLRNENENCWIITMIPVYQGMIQFLITMRKMLMFCYIETVQVITRSYQVKVRLLKMILIMLTSYRKILIQYQLQMIQCPNMM